jgi:bacterioferritin-associated ferredoxin
MYVCICKGITDHQIRAAARDGATSMRSLNRQLGVASQCSKCSRQARKVLREALVEDQPSPEGLLEQSLVQQWVPRSA